MILTSKNNPLIKETVTLKERKGRKQLGLFLVEGVKMAKECLESDFEIERVFLSESFSALAEWQEKFTDKAVCVSDDVFRYLSDEKTPQGILCRVRIPKRELTPPTENCLFLDGVADPGNVGTIIRTANAAGYKRIYLTRECADPYSPKCVRASMSGVFFVGLYTAERSQILSVLKNAELIVADMNGESAFTFAPKEPFALVIGNEGNGVSEETRVQANSTVKIPMRETQESLNAAVSAGILMYLLQKNKFTE